MNQSKHLLLKTLNGDLVSRPPVWMMRQAGRYLPEYMVLRRKYDFFTRVETPELVAEITLQPIDIIQPDAAIIFSDILVVPKAMGMDVQMVEKKGPYLPNPIRNAKDVEQLDEVFAHDKLDHVYQAVKICKEVLNDRVPLIGFAGAPWTLLCYMVEGQGSKNFAKVKSWCYTHPKLAYKLLDKITEATIKYLKRKVEAGVDVIQIFDSWSGLLSPADFNLFCKPYLELIVESLENKVPTILFPKGSWYALADLSYSNCSALALDWTVSPKFAHDQIGGRKIIQGNLDPSKLLMPIPNIIAETKKMISEFGTQKYIVNLGHGITPEVPVDHAKAFIDTVKSYST